MFIYYIFWTSIIAAIVSGRIVQGCSQVSDCECGEQCVDVTDFKLCHSNVCVCLAGCAVGEIYIPNGVTRRNTYCNLCSCRSRDGSPNGIPMCTRGSWCGLDETRPIYQNNPRCRDELVQEELQQSNDK